MKCTKSFIAFNFERGEYIFYWRLLKTLNWKKILITINRDSEESEEQTTAAPLKVANIRSDKIRNQNEKTFISRRPFRHFRNVISDYYCSLLKFQSYREEPGRNCRVCLIWSFLFANQLTFDSTDTIIICF